MFMNFISVMIAFIQANPAMVAMIMGLMEYFKAAVQNFVWVKSWMLTVSAFLLGFFMAIPAGGFVGIVWIDFVAQGFGLGLVASGLYKVGDTLVAKVVSKKLSL